ncbi:MAG: hypothetical protein J6S62_05310 [Bacteroidales bacterium]|nr:hypothetical protein [Bacteroidales bacterium]
MAGSYTTWNRGDEAGYWSSSLCTSDSSRAMAMLFYYSWDSPRLDKVLRCRGFSVRPVAE